MNKAVFLDRDGVINRDILDYTYRLEDFKLLDGVIDAMKVFSDKGYLLFVITNQGGIAKKLYGHDEVGAIHDYLSSEMEAKQVKLTDVYYCPHHPVAGLCLCRKPGSLMLEKAMARYDIDPSKSYFIGDMQRDIEAGEKAGVKTIKIETNASLMDVAGQVK